MDTSRIKADVAFSILSQGPIAMYHSVSLLNKDLEWLNANTYRVFDFDTQGWTQAKAHQQFKEALDFPDYYGKNLNAFKDCLGDLYDSDHKGLVLVFRHFDDFSKREKEFCQHLMDIIAIMSRGWLLNGQRLIGILQSDDPHIFYDKVGGIPPYWNKNEWSDMLRIKKEDQ